jgi:hypothetical protein
MTESSTVSANAFEIVIDIGHLPIQLRMHDAAFHELLSTRYAGFLSTNSTADVVLEVDLALDPRVTDGEVEVHVDDGHWVFQRADFAAEFDPAARVGRIRQSANPYSIDTALRILHGLLLVREGGFLLHAASAIRNGKAFLFSGLSGAGKTTISSLIPADATLLTDEISYIRREHGRYIACGTPFAGELARLGTNASAPIETVFLLAKGTTNRIDPVKAAEAIQRILRNILFFANDPAMVKTLFDSAGTFVEQVPVRRLTFYPDHRVWDMIQ